MIVFQNIICSAEKDHFLANLFCHPICCDGFNDVTITCYLVKVRGLFLPKQNQIKTETVAKTNR